MSTDTASTSDDWAPMLKPTARLKVERRLVRLAYMLRRANDEHYRSVGWAELRGALAFGLWTVGAWPTVMPPDHREELPREGEFQRIVHEYAERYDPTTDPDPLDVPDDEEDEDEEEDE